MKVLPDGLYNFSIIAHSAHTKDKDYNLTGCRKYDNLLYLDNYSVSVKFPQKWTENRKTKK